MGWLATLTDARPCEDRPGAVRRNLSLVPVTTYAEACNGAVILSLYATGMMLETNVPLRVGDTVEVEFPGAEATVALVVWRRETYFGCHFARPLSQGEIYDVHQLSPVHGIPPPRAHGVPGPPPPPPPLMGSGNLNPRAIGPLLELMGFCLLCGGLLLVLIGAG